MYLKKETLEQIKRKYSVLIVSDDDVVDAFNLQPPGVCRL